MKRLLGAVIAGGRARRFGSDKALAPLDGAPLIVHAVNGLAAQAHEVVVCGRAWDGLRALADRPGPGLGPLGGLCAALALARAEGFDAVLSAPCDAPIVPTLPLGGGEPVYVQGCPVMAVWPARLAGALHAHLADGGDRSVRAWARAIGARPVLPGLAIPNVNTPADLAALNRREAGALPFQQQERPDR